MSKSAMRESPDFEWRTPFFLAVPIAAWCFGLIGFYFLKVDPDTVLSLKNFGRLLPDVRLWEWHAFIFQAKCAAFAAWLAIIGVGAGFFALTKASFSFDNKPEAFCFSLGLGWGIIALIMLLLGLLRLWHVTGLFVALGAATPFAIYWVFKLYQHEYPAKFTVSRTELALSILLSGAALVYLPGCFIPETFYDALVYHLSLPAIFLRNHAIIPTPHNLYSGIPMLMEMLYSFGIAAGIEETSHIINWLMAAAVCLSMIAFSIRFTGRLKEGLLASLIFYSTPLVGVLSWKTTVELGWTFFQWLTIYAIVLRFKKNTPDMRWTILGGILAGFTMGIKYPAWPIVVIIPSVMLWGLKQEETKLSEKVTEMAMFFAVTFLVLFLWPLKNFLFYNNPVYPFYQEYFNPGGLQPDWRGLLADGHARNLAALLSWEGLKTYLAHPWTALAAGKSEFETTGPFIFMSLPFLFFARPRPPGYKILKWTLILLWLSWSFSTTMTRFFMPQVPILSILTIFCIEKLIKPPVKRFLYIAIIGSVSLNLASALGWYKTYWPDPVVFGGKSKSYYLSKILPSYPRISYPAMEFINDKLPEEAKIVFIAEPRGFYCKRDYFTSTVFDTHPLAGWVKQSRNSEELYELLKNMRITHFMFNIVGAEFLRRSGQTILPFNEAETRIYSEFCRKHLKRIWNYQLRNDDASISAWCEVYEVTENASATG